MKIGIQSLLPTEKAQALRKTSNAQELLYHHITNTIRKAIWIGLIFGCHTMASAQQKIKDGSISGNNLPNKDALLELESNNKGLLHARVALRLTTDAFPLTTHVAGMMVYNTTTINDVVPGIYYNDGSKWVFVKSSNAILVEDQLGKTGAPGIPGTVGGPGAGVTIVNNDSGTWVFNPTTNTWTNIRGPQGPQGPQGVAGTNGTNGTDGKSINSGTTVPSGGSNGDTYINTTTGDVYTNIGGVWTVTGNLRGPQGPQGVQGVQGVAGTNGTDGKSVSSGAGAPSGGSNGDTYINTTTGDIYTNIGGVWTVTGNVRGPQGVQGVQGVAGTNGTNGTDGKSVSSGTTVPSGGSNGDTYINTTTGDVYTNTGGIWTVTGNIRGPQGPQGIQGIQGVAGTNGTNGTDGKSVSSGTTAPSGGSNGDTYINTTTGDIYTNTGGVWTVTGNLRGPQGPQGIQGIQGVTGTNGTNGTDGRTILSGTGAPSAGTGNNGDYYYDPTANTIYGPKAGGAWPAGVSLVGPQGIQGPQGLQGIQGVAGTNGTNGKSVSSGAGAPSGGSNGDTYINTTTGDIYTNTGGVWNVTGNIRGPQGVQGLQGVAGTNGTNGTNGIDGKTILSGTGAPSAGTGSDGDYYYDPTTNMIYGPKAGGAWPAGVSLVGPQGIQGPQGLQGIQGVAGTNGTNGTDGKSVSSGTTAPSGGSNGDTYINTTTGDVYTNIGGVWTVTGNVRGPQGPQGVQGVQGVAGTNGTDGKSVSSGAGAPSGGSNGDTYINTTTGDIYTNTGGVWTVTGNIRGPQGPQGIQGIQGVAGTNGTNGTDGKSVSSGTTAPSGGSNGDTYINTTTGDVYTNTGGVWTVTGNIRGPQGVQGVQGVAGTNGTNGTDGKSVSSGTTAPSGGSNGDTYINTTTGDVYTNIGGVWTVTGNLRGPQGPQGIQGIQGVTGTNGTNGTDGRTILSGTGAPSAGTGNNGDYYYDPTTNTIYGPKAGGAWPAGVSLVGPQGIQGPQGLQGIQGVAGTNGTNGTDGKSVSSGAGAPSGGSNGDTYINTTTGDVYTNTGGVWTVTGNIRGPQGVQGIQGIQGVAGTNGTDGKSVSSGTTAPSGGSNGDTYINTTTGDIYTNTGGVWTVTGNIRGPQGVQGIQGVAGTNGTNGTDGKSVSSGAGVPSGGSNGDTYINTTTGDVYTNTGGVWAVTGNIKGPQGPAGTTAAVTADNGLTKTADNIQLGGPLVTPTVITTDATNTLAIAGLQTGASTDNLVVMGAGGVLKSINPSALSVTEVDGVIGNEVTDATANGGLTRAGVGTAASPYTLGLTPGSATGNVMTWNGTSWNPAAPVNIYNANGTLTSNRQVNMGGRSLRFVTPDRDIYFDPNGRIGTEAKGANDGDIYVSSGSGPTYSRLDMQSFPSGQINLTTTGAGAEQMMIGTSATTLPAPLIFSTTAGSNASGAERMRITGTGLVGIDTDDPTEKLDIGVGNVRIRDINLLSGNTTTDKMVLADVDGILKTAAIPTALNVYSSNGALSSDRTITTGSNFLRFTGNGSSVTVTNTATQGRLGITSPGASGRGSIGLSGGSAATYSALELFADESGLSQINATGTGSTGLSIGTSTTATPVTFKTNGAARMTVTSTGEVAIGATTAPSFVVGSATVQPKLHVAGDISTTGKIYTTNSVYADYVFEDYFNGFSKIYKDYKFRSLKEVAEFIKKNKHLPGVTPINEIAVGKNGYTIDLTQLSMQQLEKLEELYLHVIEMNDTLSQKDKEIKVLQNKTNELEERLKKLEQLLNIKQ